MNPSSSVDPPPSAVATAPEPAWARRAVVGALITTLAYAGWLMWVDLSALLASLEGYRWSAFGLALGLAFTNYVLRWVRWHLYLDRLNLRVGTWMSLLVFLAGFAMTVTPGKVGELIKAWILRRSHGATPESIATVVVAERATDALAMVVLVASTLAALGVRGGATGDRTGQWIALAVAASLTMGGLAVLRSRRAMRVLADVIARVPGLGGLASRVRGVEEAMRALVDARTLGLSLGLAVLAWGLEGVALAVLVDGFEGQNASWIACTYIYSATTILGGLSFLPAGVGVTEASMGWMLTVLSQVETVAQGGAATLLCRLATLWFAVGLGVLALWPVRGYLGTMNTTTRNGSPEGS